MKTQLRPAIFLISFLLMATLAVQGQTFKKTKKMLPGTWVMDKEATFALDWPEDRKEVLKKFFTLEKIELQFQRNGRFEMRNFTLEGKWLVIEGKWGLREEPLRTTDKQIGEQYSTMQPSLERGNLLVVYLYGDEGKNEKGTILSITKTEMVYLDAIAPLVFRRLGN
jgi:hypothetical protein